MSCDSVLLECLLKNLKVVDEFVLTLRSEVYFSNSYSSRINGVNDLTIDSSSSALLDFTQAKT